MEKYGKFIDNSDFYLPTPENEIYTTIAMYFDNPEMTKIKSDVNFSFYATRISSLLIHEKRYLIALLPEDFYPMGTKKRLSELKWVSFQARTLTEDWGLKPIKYSQKTEEKYLTPIKLVNKDPDYTYYYRCDKYPIEIALLTPKSAFPNYSENGSLLKALETYQTIIGIIQK